MALNRTLNVIRSMSGSQIFSNCCCLDSRIFVILSKIDAICFNYWDTQGPILLHNRHLFAFYELKSIKVVSAFLKLCLDAAMARNNF